MGLSLQKHCALNVEEPDFRFFCTFQTTASMTQVHFYICASMRAVDGSLNQG